MAVTGLLVVLIFLLLFLFSKLYTQPKEEAPESVAKGLDDRLATLIEPDLMAALQDFAQKEGRSCVAVVNDLIRKAV